MTHRNTVCRTAPGLLNIWQVKPETRKNGKITCKYWVCCANFALIKTALEKVCVSCIQNVANCPFNLIYLILLCFALFEVAKSLLISLLDNKIKASIFLTKEHKSLFQSLGDVKVAIS